LFYDSNKLNSTKDVVMALLTVTEITTRGFVNEALNAVYYINAKSVFFQQTSNIDVISSLKHTWKMLQTLFE